MKSLILALLAGVAIASPTKRQNSYGGSNTISSIISSLEHQIASSGDETGPFAPISSQILNDYIEPIEAGSSK